MRGRGEWAGSVGSEVVDRDRDRTGEAPELCGVPCPVALHFALGASASVRRRPPYPRVTSTTSSTSSSSSPSSSALLSP